MEPEYTERDETETQAEMGWEEYRQWADAVDRQHDSSYIEPPADMTDTACPW